MQPPTSAVNDYGAALSRGIASGPSRPSSAGIPAPAMLWPHALGLRPAHTPPSMSAPVHIAPRPLQPAHGGTAAPLKMPPLSSAAAGFVAGARPPASHAPGSAQMNTGVRVYTPQQRESSFPVRGMPMAVPSAQPYVASSSASAAPQAIVQPSLFLGRADLAAPGYSPPALGSSWALPSSAPAPSSAAATQTAATQTAGLMGNPNAAASHAANHARGQVATLLPQQPKPAPQPQGPSPSAAPAASHSQPNGVMKPGQSATMVDAQGSR